MATLLFTGGTTGTLVKTMPASSLSIVGNFISTVGTATSLTFTAGNSIMVTGSVNIGTGTTFNASSFSHTLQGNLINNGTLAGATSTISLTGADDIISGTGSYNFNNLSLTASGINAATTTTITVAGNLATTGSGAFTHAAGGTLTMSGTTKTITGTGFVFSNFVASGTISANNSIEITGNLTSSNSFTAAGVVTLSGATKTISGAGSVSFASLTVTGSVTSSINVGVSATLNVSGSLSASAGTFTFSGSSTLNGTASLFTVIVSGTTFKLNTNAILGIANTFTISAGSFDVASTTPNTVYYNGAGSQNITATTYDNLSLATGGTKSLSGATTVNNIVSIEANGIFDGATNTLTVKGNWVNNGTFTPSTSTVAFTGTANTFIIGATTFNAVTVNKSISAATLTLSNDVSTATIALTTDVVQTGSNTLTITNTRTGNGEIFGKIKRLHSFNMGTTYEFGGPNNSINFTAVVSVTSVTMQNLTKYTMDWKSIGLKAID